MVLEFAQIGHNSYGAAMVTRVRG